MNLPHFLAGMSKSSKKAVQASKQAAPNLMFLSIDKNNEASAQGKWNNALKHFDFFSKSHCRQNNMK